MRFVIPALLVVHGLIHLMGPAKAFGWTEVAGLQAPISRAAGAMWLLAALLFLVAGAMASTSPRFPARAWWWLAALPAVALSQALIVQAWQDVRFGTVANVIILIPALVASLQAAPHAYRATYGREVEMALAAAADPVASLVTASDLAPLPPPVRRYLEFIGVPGQPRVHSFRVRFAGSMRNDDTSPWMESAVEQHTTLAPRRRLFIMRATRAGLPFEALHIFKGPNATFEVTVAGIARIINARGSEMDQSETVTFLNDMCLLAPASLIDPAIAWSEIDEHSVRATFTHERHTISARLTFAENGSLSNFESDDRYRSDGTTHERATWSTPVARYATVDGRLVPVTAEARWRSPAYDFAYARFDITEIAFNLPRAR